MRTIAFNALHLTLASIPIYTGLVPSRFVQYQNLVGYWRDLVGVVKNLGEKSSNILR